MRLERIMKFNTENIKKAWAIRKEAAEKFNCKVLKISWGLCLKEVMKKETKIDIKKLNTAIENAGSYYDDVDCQTSIWEKGGKQRIYVKAPKNYGKRFTDAGYVEIKNSKIVNHCFGNSFENIEKAISNFK